MLSNGYVADDLQTTPISAFFVTVHIFVLGEEGDFKFGTQISVAIHSFQTTNHF